MTRPLRVGVAGAGVIATAGYGVLPNVPYISAKATVTAIADTVPGRARAVAERFGIGEAYGSLDDMLDGADVDAVANLTPIPLHAELSLRILAAGRHLITEKPLATTMADADAIEAAARAAGVLVVCSPPNMIYPSRREARRLVAGGAVGQVALAKVRASHAGPAAMGWPLDPGWFYQEGSGPLFDIGVYGIDELTGILGPAKRVAAFSGITEKRRPVVGGPFDGRFVDVTADDNTVLMLDFGNSCFGLAEGRQPELSLARARHTLEIMLKAMESARTGEAVELETTFG